MYYYRNIDVPKTQVQGWFTFTWSYQLYHHCTPYRMFCCSQREFPTRINISESLLVKHLYAPPRWKDFGTWCHLLKLPDQWTRLNSCPCNCIVRLLLFLTLCPDITMLQIHVGGELWCTKPASWCLLDIKKPVARASGLVWLAVLVHNLGQALMCYVVYCSMMRVIGRNRLAKVVDFWWWAFYCLVVFFVDWRLSHSPGDPVVLDIDCRVGHAFRVWLVLTVRMNSQIMEAQTWQI